MRRLVSVAVATVLVLSLAGTAFAAKGGNKGGGGNAGSGSAPASCSVSPDPVAVGADWIVTGTGLPADAYVNVWESDGYSTTIWFAQTDAAGTLSITWHSYNVGTSTVTFTTALTNHVSTLAACSFQVD